MKKTLSIILAMLTVACTYPGRSVIGAKTSEKKARASSSEKNSKNKTRTLNLKKVSKKKVSNKKTNFQKNLLNIKDFVLDTLPISIPIAVLSMYALWQSRKSSSPQELAPRKEPAKLPNSSSEAVPRKEEWVNRDLGHFMSEEAKKRLINSDTCDKSGRAYPSNISVQLPKIQISKSKRNAAEFRNYGFGYGAILGDILGAAYEFLPYYHELRITKMNQVWIYNSIKDPSAPPRDLTSYKELIRQLTSITDDSVLTIATGEGFVKAFGEPQTSYQLNVDLFGREYLNYRNSKTWRFKNNGGFGGAFTEWCDTCRSKGKLVETSRPSCGNGGAMRGSWAGYLFDDIQDVMEFSKILSMSTHNHIYGVLGTQMLAVAVMTARLSKKNGNNDKQIKKDIKNVISEQFGITLDEHLLVDAVDMGGNCVKPYNCEHCETTLTVPQALYLVVREKNKNIEEIMCDVNALGMDTDTQGDIALAVAEFIYPISKEYKNLVENELKQNDSILRFDEIQGLISEFEKHKAANPGQHYFEKT